MAQETLISPGVLTRENDQSLITQGTVTVGLTLVGPTVKGQPYVPTVVTSYSDFKNRFGGSFISGGANYEYLTSISAYNYFLQGGSSILVTRVTSGSYTPAVANVDSLLVSLTGSKATGSFSTSGLNVSATGSQRAVVIVDNNNNHYIASNGTGNDFSFWLDNLDYGYFSPNSGSGYTLNQWTSSLINFVNNTPDLSKMLTLSSSGSNINAIATEEGTGGNGIQIYVNSGIGWDLSTATLVATLGGGSNALYASSFTLETLNYGVGANNTGSILSNGALVSGSSENVRWQVTNVNQSQGTFTLLVRRGDDNTNTPVVLETFTNLSLDPLQPNYISAVIGDQAKTVQYDNDMGGFYIQVSGSYPNNSRYVRVKSVRDTPNYFNNAGGIATDPLTGLSFANSLPLSGSGSNGGAFASATGDDIPYIGNNLFNNLTNTSFPQGIPVANYVTASNILSNKDEYDYELLITPGLQQQNHATAQANFIANAEERGDHFYIMDLTAYGATINTPVTEASGLDTNYAGAYWPWVQVVSQETGRNVWVPASTIMAGVYAFNDNVSAEWFAPAGLNRGGLGGVIQAERKLSPTNRDNLYAGKVNPIATFPNVGVTAFGQKTLQQKASSLDRINVRRLLIALKRYIGNVAKTLVFEQNTTVTRNRFLSQVTPYLESVQQRQGLFAFRVVMDETNNTPDVIDRNQLVGQIYLQPTRTAEFILLDFNIQPTGVEFGS
jgi:hypothetical protein